MFFNFDKRSIQIMLIIMTIYGVITKLSDPSSLLSLLYFLPGILIAITFHEYAHAKSADILGDDTPRREGRLTLNPIAHIDPIGFVMLLFAKFGWGKPVNVNPRNYNRDISMDKADAIVSIAGPAMNFLLAIIFTIIYFLIYKIILERRIYNSNSIINIIQNIINYTIQINIGLGVFNLIPLPPLDGSKVIKPFLSFNVRDWFERNEQMFYLVFILLWISGIAGNIISPIIDFIYNKLINIFMVIFNI